MPHTRFYDSGHRRLVYTGGAADPAYWDTLWERKTGDGQPDPSALDVVAWTRKYLPDPGAHVLEGGCGPGTKVLALQAAGYEALGVDFAARTVSRIREAHPEIRVEVGDVRDLRFESESFDGYWSLGVIEHFWNGYDPILVEAHRVLRPGGYLFLTFPYMSPLRRLKARLGLYTEAPDPGAAEPEDFYQFALPVPPVVERLRAHGFRTVKRRARVAGKGLVDEVGVLRGQGLVTRKVVRGLAIILRPLFGHVMLLVCRREG